MTIIFDPQINIGQTENIVVGLGGTGSALARHIARTVYHMKSLNIQTPKAIKFIDPDVVELTNVGRQMFTAADIGQYKAEVLARRFNAALGLGIEFYNEAFDASKHCEDRWQQPVLIGCVDNHLARRELAKVKGVWIDCGNERTTGQVIIGNHASPSAIRRQIESVSDESPETWKHLPNAAMVFPSLLEPAPESEQSNIVDISCADLLATGDQHLLINDQVASIAATYFYRLAFRQPITSFMTFVDIEGLSMRSVQITRENIEAYVPEAV
jgi:PRTRC genetic system ThiF family protein